MLFLFLLNVQGISWAQNIEAENDFYFQLSPRANNGLVGNHPINLPDGTRGSLHFGDLEFIMPGLLGLGHPRLSIEVDSKKFYTVKTGKHSGLDVVQKAVDALGLQLTQEVRNLYGYSLKDLEKPNEETFDWPSDLLTGRDMKTRLANGEPSVMHYSYQVGDSKEGKVYLKDGFYYFKEMSCKDMERFLEGRQRRIFKFISKPDRRYTFKVSISDFRSLKLKDYFQIEHQKVEVDAWVVSKAPTASKKVDKTKNTVKIPAIFFSNIFLVLYKLII